jgi:hypothetical protein
MDMVTMPLEIENEFYEAHRQKWIEDGHCGQWCVVRDSQLLGFYPGLAEAYSAGAKAFGNAPFLVKRVLPEDPVATIQRVSWHNDDQWPI